MGIQAFLAHEDIDVSEEWRECILKELRSCDIFIPLLSANFLLSKWAPQEVGFIFSRDSDVYIIPFSLDGTTPFGFLSHIQSRKIPPSGVTVEFLIPLLIRKMPRVILPKLIQTAAESVSYRGAEANICPIVPYFNKLTPKEAQIFAEASINNEQIWSASLCRSKYLPTFIKFQGPKIKPETLEALKYQIESTMKDANGNVYYTVKIGHQVWTVENLRTTRYNDGSAIPHVTDEDEWAALTTPGYCFYDNTSNVDSIKEYGALYNWYAVDTKRLAPAGWHVPSDGEWTTLEEYLIANGYNWDGTNAGNKIAKSLAAKTGWAESTNEGAVGTDLTKNNESGFSALPGGCRSSNGGGFGNVGDYGYWWSGMDDDASTAFYRYLTCGFDYLVRYSSHIKSCGFSVRLLRDN